MIALVRFECQLLEWLELLGFEFNHLLGKDVLSGRGRVDAVRLDGDDAVALILEEEVRIERHDARLVGLGHVGEDAVDHADEHAVLG